MQLNKGRVSVVIPLYNHESYIAEAVESVLHQGDLVKELIVIDDGSQDGSARIMDKLAETDQRIEFLTQENQGAHATINRGLAKATGEFVSILNSDDAYMAGRFDALVRALDLEPGSDVAASSLAFMDGASQDIENPWFDEALASFKRRLNFAVSMIDANFLMTTSNFLLRRSVLDRIGDFAPLRYTHDLEFALRWAAYGVRLAFIDRPLLRYRIHNANTIAENHDRVRVEWALCAATYMYLNWAPFRRRADLVNFSDLYQVLEKHNLTRASIAALLQLRAKGVERIDESVIGDNELRSIMSELLS